MSCECSSLAMAEKKVSCYYALFVALLFVLSFCEFTMQRNCNKGCDEVYVVREGETLQTISERCGDPYIVEENPHIQDPDDIFPGLVIKINPFNNS